MRFYETHQANNMSQESLEIWEARTGRMAQLLEHLPDKLAWKPESSSLRRWPVIQLLEVETGSSEQARKARCADNSGFHRSFLNE